MKKSLILLFIVLLSTTVLAANEDIELTPNFPYPDEHILCKNTNFERGQVLEFIWSVNDEFIVRTVVDKESTIFNGQTVKLDKVTCEINSLDPATLDRNFQVGSKSVVVGQFECNDGINNDADEFIDAQDPGCTDRGDKDEFDIPENYCEEHSDNLFCLGLGFKDYGIICPSDSVLCEENQISVLGNQQCQLDENSLPCLGVESIVERCADEVDPICALFNFMVSSCQQGDNCFELTQADKDLLCSKGDYDFCPDPEEPAPEPLPGLGDRCRDKTCAKDLSCNKFGICERPSVAPSIKPKEDNNDNSADGLRDNENDGLAEEPEQDENVYALLLGNSLKVEFNGEFFTIHLFGIGSGGAQFSVEGEQGPSLLKDGKFAYTSGIEIEVVEVDTILNKARFTVAYEKLPIKTIEGDTISEETLFGILVAVGVAIAAVGLGFKLGRRRKKKKA